MYNRKWEGGVFMSNIGNKTIMSKNLSYYLEKSGKTQKDIAELLGVSPTAINDWVKGKKYPRIDKIEGLAHIFGILKSDLIEEKPDSFIDEQNQNITIAEIVIKARSDDEYFGILKRITEDIVIFEIVKSLCEMDDEKLNGIIVMLNAFLK